MICLTRDSRHPDTKCRRDGQGPEILVLTRMQVHTYNELDCTLNKNDHTAAVKFAQIVYDAHHMQACTPTGLTIKNWLYQL